MKHHPFAEHLALEMLEAHAGHSTCALTIGAPHLNPHRVVHGAVLFALADTGMGAALYPTLDAGQSCASVEVKINFFRPATEGRIVCQTSLVNRGRTLASLESRLHVGSKLVATASGTYAIFAERPHGAA